MSRLHRTLSYLALILLTLLTAAHAGNKKIAGMSLENIASENISLEAANLSFDTAKKELWNQLNTEARERLTQLKSEYDNRALKFGDKTMRISVEKRGSAPEGGYPLYIALHGGGSAPDSLNDSQWEAMKYYYNASVGNGVYVAARGITNSWKLHWEDESFPLYDKLIESAILFDNVNPSRVYILGFSAGGDGVYSVTPRMPGRFAAANMSAGHHNWVTFDNLHNTPFLLQVGERDSAYNRNRVAAENHVALNKLQQKYGSGFLHETFIHTNGSHNSWRDNDASRKPQSIMANPVAWLDGDRSLTSANTNAIDWLNKHKRALAPQKIVWDLSVGATSRTYQSGADLVHMALAPAYALNSWLDVSTAGDFPKTGKLVAELDKTSNTVKVTEVKDISSFRILLNPYLLDLSIPVNVEIHGKLIGSAVVTQTLQTMTRTLLERLDIDQVYSAQIALQHNAATNTWEIAR